MTAIAAGLDVRNGSSIDLAYLDEDVGFAANSMSQPTVWAQSEIADDAESYIAEARHADEWAAEDPATDVRLPSFDKPAERHLARLLVPRSSRGYRPRAPIYLARTTMAAKTSFRIG